ncbi:MAG TPA: DUF6569 family protein [Capsulimonadaceae bacterium]
MRTLSQTLDKLRFGPAQSHANLHAFPLLADDRPGMGYLVLDDAAASGAVRITESGNPGRVPAVQVTNDCDEPVFLLDGQELIGAMQDRVLNTSVLVPPRASLVAPVSCVEAARWDPETAEFSPSRQLHFARGRALRVSEVTRTLIHHGEASGDQVEVWAAIEERAMAMNVTSSTRSHNSLFDNVSRALDGFVAAIKPARRQVGVVFAIGIEIVGCDLFDSPGTLAASYAKLVRSAALDALVSSAGGPPPIGDAAWFMDRVRRSRTLRFASAGLGEDIRLCADRLSGGALIAGGRVVHLCAFDVEEA